MEEKPLQLPLALAPSSANALHYLIPHSGVVEAIQALDQALLQLETNEKHFAMFYLYGEQGSGKSHIVNAYCDEAVRRGIPTERFELDDNQGEKKEDRNVSFIVSVYEQLKANGGLLCFASRYSPKEVSSNPHLVSRLLAGQIFQLEYPRGEELQPILRSLLERQNLQLSAHSVDYLMRRIPRDPLSFSKIFAKISALSFLTNQPAKFTLIKNIVAEALVEK